MSEFKQPPGSSETIQVTIVSFTQGKIWRRELSCPVGATVADALVTAGYFSDFQDMKPETIPVGIYGKHSNIHQVLSDQDRVEIYAPLRVDPKIARRRRAAHREKTRNIKKKMPISDLTQ